MRKTPSIGKIVLACVVALPLGLLQPFALALSILCVAGTIIMPVLFAWAGFAPALVYLTASLASVGSLYGASMAGIVALLFAVPGAIIIGLMMARAPYFTRLKAAVASQLGAMLALILILYAGLGRSLVDALVEVLSRWADELPSSLVSVLLQQFALNGLVDAELSEAALSGTLTAAESVEALRRVFELTGEALRLALPAMLFSSGLITGILSTILPGKICARRGDDLEYIPLRGWFVPGQLTIGILIALLTALILNWAQVNGSEAVLTAVLTAGMVVYITAGAAAFSRRLIITGHSMTFRVVFIGLAVVLAQQLLALIGLFSALFGRRGLITGFIQKKSKDKEDDNL